MCVTAAQVKKFQSKNFRVAQKLSLIKQKHFVFIWHLVGIQKCAHIVSIAPPIGTPPLLSDIKIMPMMPFRGTLSNYVYKIILLNTPYQHSIGLSGKI